MSCTWIKRFFINTEKNKIKIGLVTSGLYQKAWPEIIAAFSSLNLGEPLDFYDAIITAGQAIKTDQCGTLGELCAKPHPWLYSECARVGLGVGIQDTDRIIGIEDSSAGIMSIRLAGFSTIGIGGGNIKQSGMDSLQTKHYEKLSDAIPYILGKVK